MLLYMIVLPFSPPESASISARFRHFPAFFERGYPGCFSDKSMYTKHESFCIMLIDRLLFESSFFRHAFLKTAFFGFS